jgi:D-alanyl-D-alanine carboxypeptidase
VYRRSRTIFAFLRGLTALLAFAILLPTASVAAPYAAMVMDARSGEILHSRNADTRLHPASLTKMMTLYVVFEAVENGEIGLDDYVRISRNSAAEPPSKLGLLSGQKIRLRYLIRAAAVKSANDAATALGEAISGSEAAFARRMNRTAKALGMTNSTFKNAHGLTESGHLSTARDMTILGRHILYDYPEYYNLFSRISADAGVKQVNNTNRKLLAAYRGADGIKTGYTRAAGFNLVASAERGQERIIATVFGGRSTATRNARVAELLDMGFQRAPTQVAFRAPRKPVYSPTGQAGHTIRAVTAVKSSPYPQLRPTISVGADAIMIAEAIEAVQTPQTTPSTINKGPTTAAMPMLRPTHVVSAVEVQLASFEPDITQPDGPDVVTRISTSGDLLWGITIGTYGTRYHAEKALLKTALSEMTTLDGSLRKVVSTSRGYEANFLGMNLDLANLACRRLGARQQDCIVVGPPS